MADRLLLIPGDTDSNPAIDNFIKNIYFLLTLYLEETKIKKEAVNGHIFKYLFH